MARYWRNLEELIIAFLEEIGDSVVRNEYWDNGDYINFTGEWIEIDNGDYELYAYDENGDVTSIVWSDLIVNKDDFVYDRNFTGEWIHFDTLLNTLSDDPDEFLQNHNDITDYYLYDDEVDQEYQPMNFNLIGLDNQDSMFNMYEVDDEDDGEIDFDYYGYPIPPPITEDMWSIDNTCNHDWQEKHLFTSTYIVCTKCGKEK